MAHEHKSKPKSINWKRRWWNHLVEGTRAVIVITGFIVILQTQGCFNGFENATLDWWLRLKIPRQTSNVIIVEITNDNFKHLFKSNSPLDPEVLHQIISGIVSGQPRVVGVDLDTSTALLKASYARLRPASAKPPIIWARDAYLSKISQKKKPTFVPLPILGGNQFEPPLFSGLALLPRDSDGVVRRYNRTLYISPDGNRGEANAYMDTFPWAVVKAGHPEHKDNGELGKPYFLNFLGNRYNIPRLSASDVLQAGQSEGWKQRGPLRDKIVLLGGTYRVARDEYVTPLGPMAGVELMAQVIETELTGGFDKVKWYWKILADLLLGYIMVSYYALFKPRTAFYCSLISLPLLAIVGSYAIFSALGYWASYVALLVAIWIHQLYEDSKMYRKMSTRSTS